MTPSRDERQPQIALPPCIDDEDAREFYRLLMAHVRELKVAGEPANLHYFLLTQVMHQHRPRRDIVGCTSCLGSYPCPTVVALALVSRFPIPWTPISLARALEPVTGIHLWVKTDEIVDASIGDEVDTFRRDADGTWVRTRSGRSGTHVTTIGGDAAMCERLADTARQTTISHYADRTPEPDVNPAALESMHSWWEEHRRYPYLEDLLYNGAPRSPTFVDDTVPEPFVRLSVSDAIDDAQEASWAVPPHHRLNRTHLFPIARCGECRRTGVYRVASQYVLITRSQGHDEPAVIGDTTDYEAAHAAMVRHGQDCTPPP